MGFIVVAVGTHNGHACLWVKELRLGIGRQETRVAINTADMARLAAAGVPARHT